MKLTTKLKRAWYKFRDSVTGRYVTEMYAKRKPRTTQKEKTK